MSPTTATPLSWRSKNHTTAVAPSMPISATGARGKKWLSVSSTASVPRPRIAVGSVRLVEVAEHLAYLVDERRHVLGDPQQLAQLRGGHRERDAGEVPDQHGPRQQVGQGTEPQDPADQAADADHQRQRGGERDAVLAGGDQRPERRRRHQRGRRLGTDRELARRAEEDVHGQAADRRPQGGFGRDAGHLGVRHHLRDQVRRHGDAGEHVAAQPRPLVAADPGGHRHGLHGVRLEPVDERRRAPANRFRVVA